MKKILFSVFMFLSIPVFAGVSSTFPYGLKASTITATGQSMLSSTTVNGTLSVSSTTSVQTLTANSNVGILGSLILGAAAGGSPFKLDISAQADAARINNLWLGYNCANSAICGGGGYTQSRLDLGNSDGDSQSLTTKQAVTNATAAQQFTARLATSNTTADYFRWNISRDGGATTETGLFGMNYNRNVYTKYGLIVGSTLTVRGLTYTWPSAHAVGALTNDGTGNLSWTSASVPLTTSTVAATPMVWTDTQTFQQDKVFVGNYIADIPVIVASGTMHEVASKTFNVSFQDNRRYELVFISTCTTADLWGARFNGDTASHYAHARTYTFSNGTGGDVSAESYAYFANNYNATTNLYTLKASMQIRLNDPLASVTIDWQSGIGAIGQGNATNSGHSSWSVANTLPTTMTLVHMSGTCSGAYKITTTAWDASF